MEGLASESVSPACPRLPQPAAVVLRILYITILALPTCMCSHTSSETNQCPAV